jgi:cytochrome c-type biogenesis protein CcmH
MILALMMLVLPLSAYAGEAAPVAADVALEKRVNALSEELRCLVCQNQTIADSHAELAIDLKNQIREKLKQGASEREVVDYLVQRYGDFVLYRPPVKSTTWLLWFGPFLLLILGLVTLAAILRKRRHTLAQTPEPSNEERERAAAMLMVTNDKERA